MSKLKRCELFNILVLISFLYCPGLLWAQEGIKKQEIFHNVTGGCGKGQILGIEQCYKAQMMRAYVDVLIRRGFSLEDIYYKLAYRFSMDIFLHEEIRERVRQRFAIEAKSLKPRLVINNTNYHFGELSRSHQRISSQITLMNKGKAPLEIQKVQTDCGCLSISLAVGNMKSDYFGVQGSPADWKMFLLPQQEGVLELVLDLYHPAVPSGPFKTSFVVMSNDSYNSSVTVSIDAEVVGERVRNKERDSRRRRQP